ncbi:MAG: hypothetical protein U9Q81_17910 [Pseudomonadota bacterium]|nr:hypothetical protein [Pseudomonadota bacterium]
MTHSIQPAAALLCLLLAAPTVRDGLGISDAEVAALREQLLEPPR